jgi:hypothetical protein
MTSYIIAGLAVVSLLQFLLYMRLRNKVTILSSSVSSVARKLSFVHGRIDNTLEKIDEIGVKKKRG